MKKVCCDIDGVVLNLMLGVERILNSKGFDFDHSKQTSYSDFTPCGVSNNIVYKHAFGDIKTYDFAPFMDGSIDAIKRLKEFVEVEAYTGSIADANIMQKRENLCADLGMNIKVYNGKKPCIMDADALFDDCIGVHEDWIKNGSKAKLFLIDACYNKETEENKSSVAWGRVIRCKNLQEAVNLYLEGLR